MPKNNAYYAVFYLGGEGDISTEAAKTAYIRAVQWLRADGYPGTETFRRLAATPSAPVPPLPAPSRSPLVEYISVNLAGYNDPQGIETAVARAQNDIPDYLRPKGPLWFHFQECSKPMLEHLDKALLSTSGSPRAERAASPTTAAPAS